MSTPLAITVSLAARREAQKLRVRRLYRKSLHHTLDWCIFREPFYKEASALRARFDQHKDVTDLEAIDRLISQGEAEFMKKQHPEPYYVNWSPEGPKYGRNPPLPPVEIIKDWGKENWTTH